MSVIHLNKEKFEKEFRRLVNSRKLLKLGSKDVALIITNGEVVYRAIGESQSESEP